MQIYAELFGVVFVMESNILVEYEDVYSLRGISIHSNFLHSLEIDRHLLKLFSQIDIFKIFLKREKTSNIILAWNKNLSFHSQTNLKMEVLKEREMEMWPVGLTVRSQHYF